MKQIQKLQAEGRKLNASLGPYNPNFSVFDPSTAFTYMWAGAGGGGALGTGIAIFKISRNVEFADEMLHIGQAGAAAGGLPGMVIGGALGVGLYFGVHELQKYLGGHCKGAQ